MIGEAGERLGRRVGSKFDWYCLCLDAHALEIRKQHAIFQGPFKVKMTMEDRPTPEHAKEYEMIMGRKVPETVPMWRVQTKGYMTDRGFRVGMVARPWGFEDSPDAEIISGGVCAKGLDAVALGRHGNFFGWGFAASPGYMTDEANTVLANAICYIAKFDGQGVITRKYDDRVANKDDLKIQKYAASVAAYEHNLKGNRQHTEMMQRTAKEAAAKKEKGEKISRFEEIAIGYKPAPEQTREQWMRSRFRDLYARFGNDEKAYHRYYDENYDYFYPGDGRASGGLKVDEDAKALGIANTDHRILAKCISDWERGENVERARRVLERYTMLDFASAREWRSWYDQNKSRLFFTQSGGWVFMVNTRDPKVEGNDYAREQSTTVYRGVQTATTDDLNPVSIASGVVDVGNGKKELVTKFKIHPGYHIYAMVAPNDAFTQTKVSVELPAGFSKVGDLQMPGFSPKGENTGIFTDEIAFKQEISGNGQGEAIVKIEYQCCDARICFPPVEREIRVRL
jgi:hypothetical protein